MNSVTESIFSGATYVIPMKEVQFVEHDKRKGYEDAISVILSGTTWNVENDFWNNAPWIRGEEAESFMRCWCTYRSELEADDLMDLTPNEIFPGTMDDLSKLDINN